jgi:hypothetical protein
MDSQGGEPRFWASVLAVSTWVSSFRVLRDGSGTWRKTLGQWGLNIATMFIVAGLLRDYVDVDKRFFFILAVTGTAGFVAERLPPLAWSLFTNYLKAKPNGTP